ncbi:NAD-dependent deacetylase [Rhodoligotrophos appendicifer]|uniref:SIR2 family NAD-dependent protein deacylase n=1 Tax=Rhodoligotrophos appendicifer TaxID=987056 RepID=UPI0011872A4D|nr:Sir2 family NAD-dependent protein deacetylase [Rhodoligotrophos appendicifer]
MSRSDDLLDLVLASQRLVAFTGAGISTESGIPDFRSPGGFWSRNKPIEFGDFVRSGEMRREAWRRKFELDDLARDAQPNAGHLVLAHLSAIGRLTAIITQNIDDLHHRSGVPAEAIVELHGNGSYARCLDCGGRQELHWIRRVFETEGTAPDCPACGGLLKSATISFGQQMPPEPMREAEAAARNCDLFLAIGSSLVVQPANQFLLVAKRSGARLVIVNRDPTPFDDVADLVIHDEIGATLAPLRSLDPAQK